MPGAPRTVLEHQPPSLVTRWPQTVALLGLLAYLFVSLDRLAVFPAVGQDEPWIAAAPYKLATQGILARTFLPGTTAWSVITTSRCRYSRWFRGPSSSCSVREWLRCGHSPSPVGSCCCWR